MKELMASLQVNADEVEAFIEKVEFSTVGVKTTLCVLTLINGFEVTATSSCVDPIAYNQAIGEKFSLAAAKDQVWQLLGFLKQEFDYIQKNAPKEPPYRWPNYSVYSIQHTTEVPVEIGEQIFDAAREKGNVE